MKSILIDKTSHIDKNEKVKPNDPKYLVLHATHSYPEWKDLIRCHLNRGFSGIGYHIFVSKSGKVYKNREFNCNGAHCIGFNQNSIGLCFYLGEELQENVNSSVKKAIEEVLKKFPEIKIISHTQGQLMYLNKLLEKNGFGHRFFEEASVVEQGKFEQIKKDAELLIEKTSASSVLCKMLKNLKNCPEKYFFELTKS
ncbi:MAG: N-acetylmuramoyl-L-alanine amidase [Candidatus Pacearchaeota archaeon]